MLIVHSCLVLDTRLIYSYCFSFNTLYNQSLQSQKHIKYVMIISVFFVPKLILNKNLNMIGVFNTYETRIVDIKLNNYKWELTKL